MCEIILPALIINRLFLFNYVLIYLWLSGSEITLDFPVTGQIGFTNKYPYLSNGSLNNFSLFFYKIKTFFKI